MAITDNRTSINAADATTNWVNAAGSASGNQNTETFIEGSASISLKISSARDGIMYNMGSAQNWANNHFYIWWNCSTSGKLDTLTGAGVAIRFCGATVTDWFEVWVAGSDTYTGGFKMSVIDIETASASPDGTNGTPPATSAIQYVGVVFDVTGMISGNVDNCFVDAMWRLPQNTPGMLVEGQNTGSVDWTWQDIVNAADSGDTTKAWGTAFRRDGVVFINTPIRFGANDAVTHGFSDSSEVVAWENQLVASNFYGLEVIGGTGTQSFSLGTRVGTGDASVGSEGCVFTADSTGQRYYINAVDSNIDAAEFFGCTFLHAATLDISNANSEVRSCLLSDVSAVTQADASGDGVYQKNSAVNSNTADGVALLTTDNPATIKNSSFVFSDGHAIEITATGTYTFTGNTFTNFGSTGTTDAAIYNNSGGLVTLNIDGGGDSPTYRNGTSASTVINNTVTLTVTVENKNSVAIQNAQVLIQKRSTETGDFGHPANPFTSSTGNNAGDADFVITGGQTIPADVPSSGTLSVYQDGVEQTYRYASWSGSTFTLLSEISNNCTGGGSGTSLQDTVNDFTALDIEEGDTVRNTTDGSWAIVRSVDDADNITTTALRGGTDNTWTSGDTYSFHRLALTYVSGTDTATVPLLNADTDGSGQASVSVNYDADKDIFVRVRKSSTGVTRYIPFTTNGTLTSTGFSLSVTLIEDSIAAA